MTFSIAEQLKTEVEAYGRLGHPALMQRFVISSGKLGGERLLDHDYGQGAAKECFRNAAQLALEYPELTYVEGYGYLEGLPLLIHHAWCEDQQGRVVDVTWAPERGGQYMGVRIDADELLEQMESNGVYGVLDTGRGLNVEFYFRRDPQLEQWVFDNGYAKRLPKKRSSMQP